MTVESTDTNFDFDGADDTESFHLSLTKDPALRARWSAISATVIQHADALGVKITKADVAGMPSARLCALVGQPLGEFYERELANLPAVLKAKEQIAFREKLQAGDEAAQKDLSRMRPSDRIAFAREQGMTGPAPREPQSAEDQAAQYRLLLLLNPAERIAAARRMGLKV